VKKRYRLRNNADFEKVYKYGKAVADRLLVLKYKRNSLYLLRTGFSVSKRVGKAVARNRIKRRLKDIVQKRIHLLNLGYDLIFIVRQEAKDAEYADLLCAVSNLLKKARVLKDV